MKNAPAPTKIQGAIEQLELFDASTFCPICPSPGTLADQALTMFMNGEVFDHPDFEARTKSWRLSDAVFTLRRELNWPIETIDIPSPTDHSPGRKIALYRLDLKYIEQAKAMIGSADHE
jgi:hypothetical protein